PIPGVPLEIEGRPVLLEDLHAVGRQVVLKKLLSPLADLGVGMLDELPGPRRIDLGRLDPLGFDLVEQEGDPFGATQKGFEDFAADGGAGAGPELEEERRNLLVRLATNCAECGDSNLTGGVIC